MFVILGLQFLMGTVLLVAQEDDGGRPKPAAYCTPTDKQPDHRCMCLMQDQGQGCKDGKRDVEQSTCSSYCWKTMCHCCLS